MWLTLACEGGLLDLKPMGLTRLLFFFVLIMLRPAHAALPVSRLIPMVDHLGEASMLRFRTDGSFATFIFQNHGEAYNIMALALATHFIPPGLAILHIDHHDDMELPGPGIELMKPAQCNADYEPGCPLHNDNQLLATIIKSAGAVNRIMWLYPAYTTQTITTAPHTCVLGKAHAVNGRYSHRTVLGKWWGLENASEQVQPPGMGIVCGSTPFFKSPGMYEYDPTRPLHEPLNAYKPLVKYDFAMTALSHVLPRATSTDPAVVAVREVVHGIASWFPPKKPWILDIDLDYLIQREETADGNPHLKAGTGQDFKHTLSWLCNLTVQCHRIMHERELEPPLKPEITDAEIRERVSGVYRVLKALLPSRPCLITIARSNQGAFTPLRWTMAIEDAILVMLEQLYGRQPIGVQYLRSAFGSHDVSVATFDRIERERPTAKEAGTEQRAGRRVRAQGQTTETGHREWAHRQGAEIVHRGRVTQRRGGWAGHKGKTQRGSRRGAAQESESA